MTQAFNLSQLANNLDSTGRLDATDGLVNAVPVANGGTGASTASAARTNLGLSIGTDLPSNSGTGATGTWPISVTGNAATATQATNATNVNGGRVVLQNGSVTSPSMTFTNEGAQDTGFYWETDGFISIANNGVRTGQFAPGGLNMGGYSVIAGNLLGQGQSWVDLTGSRAWDVTYTNNTSRPIQVSITVQSQNGSSSLWVQGVRVARVDGPSTYYVYQMTAIVPPGATYFGSNGGTGILITWAELR